MKGSSMLLFVFGVTATIAAIPIHIESVTCFSNEKYCSNLSCSVETIRKKMQVYNFECIFNDSLDNLIIKFTLFRKVGAEYKNFIINSTEDLCKVLDKTERSNVISRMLPMWKNYGRFPKSCPIRGEVSMRRYPMDLSFYPSLFPSGDFKIVIELIEANNYTSILNVTSLFNIKYT